MKRLRTAPAAAAEAAATPVAINRIDDITVLPHDQLGQRAVYLNSTTTQASATHVLLYSRIRLQPSRQTISIGSCVHYFELDKNDEEESKVGFIVRIQVSHGATGIDNCELVLHEMIRATQVDNVFEQDDSAFFLYENEAERTISPQQITMVTHIDFNSSVSVSPHCNQVFTSDNYLQPLDHCRKFLFDEALHAIFPHPPPVPVRINPTEQTTHKPRTDKERIVENNKKSKSKTKSAAAARPKFTAGVPLHPKLSHFQISDLKTWTPQTVDWNL